MLPIKPEDLGEEVFIVDYEGERPILKEPPETNDDKDRFDDWINDAVAAFARMHGMRNRLNLFWTGGADS